MSNASVSRSTPQLLRRIVPLIVIVVSLMVIGALLIQQVAAQSTGGLKPPFRLIQPPNMSAPLGGVPPLPLTAPIVMSETFDSGFAQRFNYDATDTTKPWHLVDDSGHVNHSYTWGRVAGQPMTDTLWNAATNPPSTLPISAGQPYTKNMQAYAIYGPINMQDYTSAFISITYAMDTLDGDLFGAAYSTNGTDFTWLAATSGRAPLSIEHTNYYPIPANVMRQNQVWIALVFTSLNRDNIDALGVYVDDVVLRALPAYKIYLPIIRLDPTPTPPPTSTPLPYTKQWSFGTGASNEADFLEWGGYKSTDCGSGAYTQNITALGQSGGAMVLNITCVNTNGVLGGTSPNLSPYSSAGINYEYSADILVVNGQTDARFGLIFDASSTTFGSSPPFDPNRNYYKLKLKISSSDRGSVAAYQIQQCTNGNACGALFSEQPFPFPVNAGAWHNFKIQQVGSALTLSLDGTVLYYNPSGYDPNWGNDRRQFGLYVEARGSNNVGGPFEIRFDNVRLNNLP